MHISVLQMVILCPNSSVARFLTVTYVRVLEGTCISKLQTCLFSTGANKDKIYIYSFMVIAFKHLTSKY